MRKVSVVLLLGACLIANLSANWANGADPAAARGPLETTNATPSGTPPPASKTPPPRATATLQATLTPGPKSQSTACAKAALTAVTATPTPTATLPVMEAGMMPGASFKTGSDVSDAGAHLLGFLSDCAKLEEGTLSDVVPSAPRLVQAVLGLAMLVRDFLAVVGFVTVLQLKGLQFKIG